MALGLAIPLPDEEALVETVVADMLVALRSIEGEVRLTLVDNGSTDGTGALIDHLAATEPEVDALHLSPNQGYGGGILAGLHHLATAHDPTVLGWAWGDGQVDPAVIPGLFAACVDGAMIAKTRRTVRQDGLQRRLVTTAYALTMRTRGVVTPDVNGCPKLLRREAFDALALAHTDWFLDAEAILGAEARGWRIDSVATTMRPRAAGRSKVGHATILEFARNLSRWRS